MPALILVPAVSVDALAPPPTVRDIARSTVMRAGSSSMERAGMSAAMVSQWDIRRARILKRDNHLCQNCLRRGLAVPATTVDHIKAKAHGGTDDDSNLESLCWPCHKTKTGRERLK
ncbi:DNAse [Klebsiella michiganensis]|uniref:Putative HNH nuclease YajD n=1 Tax=Klebsiella michiganensis TaxID=1134687 RepID=A0A7H4MW59_9ENTR|nr:DNAse [Klebsiella michiganensis]